MENEAAKPLKVLYINHYGTAGGAQRSILELISGFPKGSVKPHFITPPGSVLKLLNSVGVEYTRVMGISKFDHTRAGYYRGVRWLILIRELAYLPPTFFVLLWNRQKFRQMDVIHINEITCIVPLILAKKIFKKPVVLHTRAIINNDPKRWQTSFVKKILNKYADHIVAIDQSVASSIPTDKKISVIHNNFSLNTLGSPDNNPFSEILSKIPRRKLNIGFIGAIHKNKGIFDLLEAIRLCLLNKMDVSLAIAGTGNEMHKGFSNTIYNLLGFNPDGNHNLKEFIRRHNLESHIHPLGFSTNTADFFKYIDVICFPSYYNAIGRPVFEAAFFHKPSIVAIRNPFADTFIDGETGISVKEKDPQSILDAITIFYNNPHLIKEMGTRAFNLSINNFNVELNSFRVLSLYRSLIEHTL